MTVEEGETIAMLIIEESLQSEKVRWVSIIWF